MATHLTGTSIYRISELARSVGLSRTAILYYEKIGLLKGRRAANGYRLYSDADRQQLRLLQQLQAGGLTLQECRACLTGRIDRDLLTRRLGALDAEIADKRRARDLLAALLGQSSLRDWHETVERAAPDLHRNWLMTQGFSSEEAARVAVLSKDMNDHDAYMDAFLAIFAELDYWGPGTPQATGTALEALPSRPNACLRSAAATAWPPWCSPNEHRRRSPPPTPRPARWQACAPEPMRRGLATASRHRRRTWPPCPTPPSPMTSSGPRAAPTSSAWSGRCATGGGCCAPAEAVRAFWASEYPDMTTPARRVEQAQQAGYRVLTHFDMGQAALDAYYRPLEARLEAMAGAAIHERVMEDLRAELSVFREGKDQFGYEMFVLQRD